MKAAHIGVCQKCGATQKLPGGVLAKHGYQVAGWGFFNGVCGGTAHLPYEQSCELIKGFIAAVTKDRAAVRARIADLKQPATQPKGWLHEYVPSKSRYIHSGYHWREVELSFIESGEYKTLAYTDHEGKVRRLDTAYGWARESGLTGAATLLNQQYIKNGLEPIVAEMTRYITWQTQRVTDWKLTELRPAPPPAPVDPNKPKRQRRSWGGLRFRR